jgi:Tol biopolymer transport system component
MGIVASGGLSLLLPAAPAHAGPGGWTHHVSRSILGTTADGDAARPMVSDDGRAVAFTSAATNLLDAPDSNGVSDVFVRTLSADGDETLVRASVASSGAQANGASRVLAVNGTAGRFVVFESHASNLVDGDTNGRPDVFLRDVELGTTEQVNVSSAEVQAAPVAIAAALGQADVSPNGRYVAFAEAAANLVGGDFNKAADVFVRDRVLGTTRRMSVSSAGVEGNDDSVDPQVSDDGSIVAFVSQASNLAPADADAQPDVFVRNRAKATTELASIGVGGAGADGAARRVSLSGDGSRVAFVSGATNLVIGDTNHVADLFVRHRLVAKTTRVSLTSTGAQLDDDVDEARMSANGQWVVFHTASSDVVPGVDPCECAYLRTVSGVATLTVAAARPDGTEVTDVDAPAGLAIDADGSVVAFAAGDGVVPSDANGLLDVFARVTAY